MRDLETVSLALTRRGTARSGSVRSIRTLRQRLLPDRIIDAYA